MIKLNAKGFGPLEILLIIVVIGIIGLAGLFVLHSKKSATPSATSAATTSSPSNTEQSTASNSGEKTVSGEFVISEWGVKATVPSTLTGVSYKVDNDKVTFNSNEQKKITSCGDELNPQTAWGISREKAGSLVNPDGTTLSDADADKSSSYIHIDDYYYHRVYPQSGCSNSADQLAPIDAAYQSLFKTLAKN